MNRILKHIGFWTVILIFQVTRSHTGSNGYTFDEILPLFLEHFTMLPILILASYFTSDFLFPEYFYRKRYLAFSLLMLCSVLVFVLIMRSYLYYVFFPKYYPDINTAFPRFFDFNIFQHIFYIYSTVAFVVMFKYISRVRRIEEQKSILEKQNLTSELAFLHSQINPHFLFNTLNNINALIKKDPDRTYSSILKLSEIMRYMLYDARSERVLLSNEIEYLNSFIGLLLLRVEKQDFIKFGIIGDPSTIMVAPMLFIPFVENAFKHGNKDVSSPGIVISLSIDERSVSFEVTNYLNLQGINTDPVTGIGIPNLERRLSLIYPGKHYINIEETEGKYIASLKIETD